MTFPNHPNDIEGERAQLRDAIQRLRAGAPARSNGKLTVTTLAIEAGLARQRLYEQHADLVNDFKVHAGGGPIPPNVAALQQQLADAHERITQLESTNTLLQQRVTTLSALISELSFEAQVDNVVTMPRRRRTRTSSTRR
jgi:hypothetical protein